MKTNWWRVLGVACVVLFTSALVRGQQPANKELAKFKGKWALDSHAFSGKPVETKGSVEFEKDRVTFRFEGQESYTAEIRVDPAKTPAEIDMSYLDGPAKGLALKGVYQLEGDKLTLCFHASDRPKKLECTEGSNVIRFVLKRSK